MFLVVFDATMLMAGNLTFVAYMVTTRQSEHADPIPPMNAQWNWERVSFMASVT